MKATGIVRPIDNLGRIVLPIELRKNLNINEKDSLEIFVDGFNIILGKYNSACASCNSTGVVRNVDCLGRVVLPIELRKTLGIDKGDPLEIFVDNFTIVLRKYEPACVFCGGLENINSFKGRNICQDCVEQIWRNYGRDK